MYNGTTTAAVTAGTLVGIVPGDSVTVSAVATYNDANVGTGKTITVVYTLDGADAAKYAAPTNTVVATGEITKATPAQPVTTFSFDGPNAGKLMGATTEMEYSLDGGTSWTPVGTNDPTLVADSISDVYDIKVHVKESTNTEQGLTQTIDITKAATPNLSGNIASAFGAIPGTIYQISYNNGASWSNEATADADGKISVPKGSFSVRVKATGTVQASDAQTGLVSI